MSRSDREIIIDSFAGGGGTSEGIRQALGREPDIAVNHDAMALAMHRVNHPGTHHMVEDVWHVDALGMCDGRPIGLLWLSPDCKHFSKAKGGKPREKAIRGLAWVGLRWVKSLPKRQRPRVIILENVEEFQDWGPLLEDGRPCPVQKGATFKTFISGFSSLGYVAEWRQLRACDYGDPTIRKRLFVILRRDRQPIVWPARTHGNPKDPADAALIAAGTLKPWRTAAEIIDFSLPCPSIFDTSAQIKEKLGLRAQRPLRPNTLSRVAKGVKRYVIDSDRPFIVPVAGIVGGTGDDCSAIKCGEWPPQAGESSSLDPTAGLNVVTAGETAPSFIVPITHAGDDRVHGVDEPLRTITTARRGEHALITPFVTKFNSGSVGHAVDQPLATVTSHASETHGGGAAPLGLVAPILVGCGGRAGQSEPRAADEPVLTQTAKADACIVAPFLVPRYQERPGQEPRTRSVEEPAATVVPGGNEGVLAAVHLSRQFGASVGAPADDPTPTITAGGAGKTAVVAAFLAQHTAGSHPGQPAKSVEEPVSTITGSGSQQGVVAAHMINLRGSERRDAAADEPLQTVSAQGNHAAVVAAFLAKYYGAGEPVQAADDPLHTVTAKPRHGLVTVSLRGEPFVITDIGMRMLTPRERFSAQGFGPEYVIDHGVLEDGTRVSFTLEQQGRFCGNSVCPGMARALVAANYKVATAPRRESREAPLLDVPMVAAE